MADTNSTDQQEAQLFFHLISKDDKKVTQLCSSHREGPLQRISVYNDTVLHMASRFKRSKLVRDLLEMLPKECNHELAATKNNAGSNILHEVAASDTMKDVAEGMLKRGPELLIARNDLGETPFFCAARYGQTEMFKFLAGEMKLTERNPEDGKHYLQRNDRTTVLHISIFTECFGLVKLLVKNDTSWHASVNSQEVGLGETKELDIEKEEKISQEIEGQNSQEKKGQNFQENEGRNYQESSTNYEYKKSDEAPLFLATMSNIQDIVEETLVCHPQALEHINKEGMNILHVAILHRHIEIFDVVAKSELLARSLLSATDNKGNSLLHMVGLKRKSQASEKMQSPAFQLQKELLLFKKVKSACKMHLTKPLNKDNQTAEELFAARNERLHRDAKEWLMRTTENCTILSVFIATVAFAAAYTVPGGPNQDTGIPILNSKPLFVVFILADVFSLTLALTSVDAHMADYEMYWKVRRLCRKLHEGPLQRTSIYNDTVLHMVAHSEQKKSGTRIAEDVACRRQHYTPRSSHQQHHDQCGGGAFEERCA
ncbi:hypothetical protein VitviT2T_004038 [Vitis vinifera]|uniref:PGG domain-containing protein n=1 Tax=Vitis vinifera TaxID=29760 RepID=A0ABY9BNT4_VITVI|nr:hypothetical protein VitviT2T_004038 [Vitis vinifera]